MSGGRITIGSTHTGVTIRPNRVSITGLAAGALALALVAPACTQVLSADTEAVALVLPRYP